MPERTVIQMRVRWETKRRLEYLKSQNQDVHWDILLEPIIKDVKASKPQCASVKKPPRIIPVVKYVLDGTEAEEE